MKFVIGMIAIVIDHGLSYMNPMRLRNHSSNITWEEQT